MNVKLINKGVTLLELVVAMAILALLGTAIVGIMGSNTTIFRKNKADLSVQTSAEETYNQIQEDIQQAKHIYIEGYKSSTDLTFKTNKVGDEQALSLTRVRILKAGDMNILDLASDPALATTCSGLLNEICGKTVTSREAVYNAKRAALSDPVKQAKFDKVYDQIKNMHWTEAKTYGAFLDSIYDTYKSDKTSFITFEDVSLKDVSKISSNPDEVYTKIYVSKIVLDYETPLDTHNVPSTKLSSIDDYDVIKEVDLGGGTVTTITDSEQVNDQCNCAYKFDGNLIKFEKDYFWMDDLDTPDMDDPSTEKDSIYSKTLNYIANTDGSDTDDDKPKSLSGVVALLDGENDALELDMYFSDKSMSFTNRGMTYLRNSYVLHDSK